MLIAGYQKSSFLDYPGLPAAVVFTPFCNMNCSYCHNSHILSGSPRLIDESTVFEHLEKRAGTLKAVVISGGEPTLQQNLLPFIERVRQLGYRVKLDTNGMKPQVLSELLRGGLLDYVAMDIKAPQAKYEQVTRVAVDFPAIRRSIAHLRAGDVPHEFRLTFAPELTKADVVEAALLVKGTAHFYLQQYRTRSERDPMPHPPSLVYETADAVREAIGVCGVRGLAVR